MKFELCEKELVRILTFFTKIFESYKSYFVTKTRSVETTASQYAQGLLLQQGRGNMTKYANDVQDASARRFQYFISQSPWEYRPVIAQIQRDVMERIGDARDGAIHIDETGFPKQGDDSVGVKRQYCGRLGKVDNCQVAVCLGYTKGSMRTLIDTELYIPEDWANDQSRREKCGIPEDLKFKTKAEISLDLIRIARSNGVQFGWVGMDSFYGRQSSLLNTIDSDGIVYMADIPSDTRVWLNHPRVGIPERKNNRGRIPTEPRVLDDEPSPTEVRIIKDELDSSQWVHTFVRDTERRELWSRIACLRIYAVEDKLPSKEQWLIIRVDDSDGATKYQLSNAPLDTTIDRFAQMSCSRYWIERAFQDEKGLAGFADFRGRSWLGWHHHITMAMFSMMMMMFVCIEFGQFADLLTVQDIKLIYEKSFARKQFSNNDVLLLLKKRHKERESAKISHHRANSHLSNV
jgi:SRSO17 transposase